jgi:hypothetical protein
LKSCCTSSAIDEIAPAALIRPAEALTGLSDRLCRLHEKATLSSCRFGTGKSGFFGFFSRRRFPGACRSGWNPVPEISALLA